MKILSLILFFLTVNLADGKEYSSVTEAYTITVPDTWMVEVEHRRTEIYFKDDAYVGQFEISVRPFLARTNAKAEYYSLKEDYTDARLTRINDIPVVICSLEDDGSKEYNWIFYHGKNEVWCLYKVVANSDHAEEIKIVEAAVNAISFPEID
ncbi:MAG: hypothetical protein JKX73_05500 [Flavobacteriales bacterium]|nr:hypothetical protein [Flavobacteriales bacterium]